MKMRFTLSVAVALALVTAFALPASAQLATGNIYGTVADASGAVLPGASVTLSGSTIGSRPTVSGSQGDFRFLALDPGSYKISVSLAGFATVQREVVVSTGGSVNLSFALKVASMEETLTVEAETPVIDTKKTGTSTNFTQDELSKVPNSRDPWALLRSVPGLLLDRVNIAGNESGQQSGFKSKGSVRGDAVWNMDGVNITDMAAIGASPTYFDYDAFEEIQIATGGMDLRQPTGGVGLNFVTKRGTNSFRGTLRGYFTHDDLESCNVPGERAAAGVTCATADHNKQIADYGADIGGPLLKDKLWFWFSWGKQDIRLNRSAGNLIDKTLLIDYNAKLNWQAGSKDMVSFLWFLGSKEKFGRATGAQQVEADTATWNQGNFFEDGRPHGLFKLEDHHVFGPNLFMTGKIAYYNTGFSLEPRGGLELQAGSSSLLGQTFGSTRASRFLRPQWTGNLDGSWFKTGMGGNHEIKFGAGWRRTRSRSTTIYPGNMILALENSATDFRARVYRVGDGINLSRYLSFYLGDTFSKDRLTVNVGLRYDRQSGAAQANQVSGNKAFPNLVPGISFDGYESPAVWSDISPRVGFTYALDDTRKTLVRASYARYASQMGIGEPGYSNASGSVGFADYRWVDLNGDHFAQANEVLTNQFLSAGGGFNPAAPTAVTSADVIDPGLKAPSTHEVIGGVDRELFANFGVSLSYTYQRLGDFEWEPRIGMTLADYAPGNPVTGTLPNGTAYNVPTFTPNVAKVDAGNNGRLLSNQPGYHQTYNGIEVAAVKRLSNKWMMRLAGSFNNHREYYDILQTYTGNPTRRDTDPLVQGGQVAPRTSGSGAGDIFLTGKWTVNLNGLYQIGRGFEIAGNLFGKQGTAYPIYRSVSLGRDGSNRVLLSPEVDSQRFKDLWNLDLRLAKNFKAGRTGWVLTADLFNAFNSNTELNRQRNLASSAFGNLTQNLSPRILRLGMRLSF